MRWELAPTQTKARPARNLPNRRAPAVLCALVFSHAGSSNGRYLRKQGQLAHKLFAASDVTQYRTVGAETFDVQARAFAYQPTAPRSDRQQAAGNQGSDLVDSYLWSASLGMKWFRQYLVRCKHARMQPRYGAKQTN